MSWRNLALLTIGALLGCTGDGGFKEPLGALGEPLDTAVHAETDLTWDNGLEARDIRWNYVLARDQGQDQSVLVVGSLRMTLLNTNVLRDLAFSLVIRLAGADSIHDLKVPFREFNIDARDTLELHENFLLATRDRAAANTVDRMTITVF
jgi:hypothetical protein